MSTSEVGLDLWFAWKRAYEQVRAAVIAEVTAGSDLSEAELTVLVSLSESGGTLRQNALVAATGWDKTRLSHLLSRMQDRAYVRRDRLRNGVEVTLTALGRARLDNARPRLVAAVDKHLSSRLGPASVVELHRVLTALTSPDESSGGPPRPVAAGIPKPPPAKINPATGPSRSTT